MPHSKAKMLGIAERRAKVAELLAEGKRQCEIAAALGLPKMKVSRDVRALEEEWKKQALQDFDEARGIQIARLEHLYGTTMRRCEVRVALQEADQPLTPAQIADQISHKCGELADAALARRIGALLQLTSIATQQGTGWWLSGRTAPAPAEPKATYHGTVNADAGQAVRENLLLNPRRSAAAVAAHQRPRRPNRNEGPFEPPLRT
jgi:hypothetical protein